MYQHEDRPWGSFERFTLNEPTTVKIITVRAGEATSLQKHAHRREFWRIIAGDGFVLINGVRDHAREGDEFTVPQGTTHRLEGGVSNMVLLEIAFGYFDENDIERIEDRYHRV